MPEELPDIPTTAPSTDTTGPGASGPTTETTAVATSQTTVTTVTTVTDEPDDGEQAITGAPDPGTIVWGIASNDGARVTLHEEAAENPLTLHRTFRQWNQRATKLSQSASADLAADRLPWVSVKTPGWAEMASGSLDDQIDEMLLALDDLDGPVWLTIHHEPEGGGGVNTPDDRSGPAGHLAMNRQVRARMDALGVDDVALAPILMSYTWEDASGRNPDEWWEDGIYDFVWVDIYNEDGSDLVGPTWEEIRRWAGDRGVPVAVGEWGVRGDDATTAADQRAWFDAAADSATDGGGARVLGLAQFDSPLNAPSGAWTLTGLQLETCHELMDDPRNVIVVD